MTFGALCCKLKPSFTCKSTNFSQRNNDSGFYMPFISICAVMILVQKRQRNPDNCLVFAFAPTACAVTIGASNNKNRFKGGT